MAGIHLTLCHLAQQRFAMPCQLAQLAVEQAPYPEDVICLVDTEVSSDLQCKISSFLRCTAQPDESAVE